MHGVIDTETAKKRNPDLKLFGDPDLWKLICKASSEEKGWYKTTKAMEVYGGCLVQTETVYYSGDTAEAASQALVFVPGVHIEEWEDSGSDEVVARYLVSDCNTRKRFKDVPKEEDDDS